MSEFYYTDGFYYVVVIFGVIALLLIVVILSKICMYLEIACKQCRDRNRIDINIENSEHTADISDVESQTG